MTFRIKYLLEQCINNTATPQQVNELLAIASQPEMQEHIKTVLTALWDDNSTAGAGLPEEQQQKILTSIITTAQHLRNDAAGNVTALNDKRKIPGIYRKIAVAASIVLVVALGAYFLFWNNKKSNKYLTAPGVLAQEVKAPDANKATIILADGRSVYLDSVPAGELVMQDGIKIIKTIDGKLRYINAAINTPAGAMAYNTLHNPRGSKVVDVLLADGSRVWLNAGSSITYPVSFSGDSRKVDITGEAYFEVAPEHHTNPGKKRSFIVQKNDLQIEVLGTKFNVNSYDNEPDIKVTLLEGLVKVSNSTNSKQIQPGQQASIHHSSFIIHHSVDTEQAIAWKNGIQSFNNADIQTIMRQVERWYNVEVSYRGTVPKRVFTGDIPATVSLSELLKLFEVNKINFEIDAEKKQLVVIP